MTTSSNVLEPDVYLLANSNGDDGNSLGVWFQKLLDDSGSFAVGVRTVVEAFGGLKLKLQFSRFGGYKGQYSNQEIPRHNDPACYGEASTHESWARASYGDDGLLAVCRNADQFSKRQSRFLRNVKERAWFPITNNGSQQLVVLFREEKIPFTFECLSSLWLETQHFASKQLTDPKLCSHATDSDAMKFHRTFVQFLDNYEPPEATDKFEIARHFLHLVVNCFEVITNISCRVACRSRNRTFEELGTTQTPNSICMEENRIMGRTLLGEIESLPFLQAVPGLDSKVNQAYGFGLDNGKDSCSIVLFCDSKLGCSQLLLFTALLAAGVLSRWED